MITAILVALVWRVEVELRGWDGLGWIGYNHLAIPLGGLLFLASLRLRQKTARQKIARQKIARQKIGELDLTIANSLVQESRMGMACFEIARALSVDCRASRDLGCNGMVHTRL